MNKTSSIFARVEPETKEAAEAILKELGISMSNAIEMFLRQVALTKGIPFDLRVPSPIDYDSLTDEELERVIRKGLDSIREGRTLSSKEFKKKMHKELDV